MAAGCGAARGAPAETRGGTAEILQAVEHHGHLADLAKGMSFLGLFPWMLDEMCHDVITTLFLLETLYLGDGTIKEDHRQTGCEQQCRNLVTKEPRRDCERMQ